MAAADRIRQKHLTCCICLEVYHGPKTLPCMHSFCEGCLSGHINSIRNIPNGFLCPMCKTLTLAPYPDAHRHQWPGQFTTDFKLTNMLEEMDLMEEQSQHARTRSLLNRTRDGLLTDKQVLLEDVEDKRKVLSVLHKDQEEVLQRMSDAFSSARQKLQSKEKALKQKLMQMFEDQRSGVHDSWTNLQLLVCLVDELVADVDRIVSPSTTTDTHVDLQTFHVKHTQFKCKFASLEVPVVDFDIALQLRKNDLAKIASLEICDIEQRSRVVDSPLPTSACSPRERASISSSSSPWSSMEPEEPSSKSEVANPVSSQIPAAQLVTTMIPENDGEHSDFQDVVVLHVSDVQIVVLTDAACNITAIYNDRDTKEYKTLKVHGHPSRVCRLDATRVAVSVSNPQRVLIIRVYPELRQIAVLKTGSKSYEKEARYGFGLTALDPNKLAVACKNKIKIVTTTDCDLADFKLKSDGNVEPWYMASHPRGYIIVSDRAGETVYCVTQTGQTLWQWKAPSVPAGVACDQDGNIYVALPDKQRIQRLNETGKSMGEAINRNAGLGAVYGIDVDEFGQIYVLVQTKSHSIQIFSKLSGASTVKSRAMSVTSL